MDFHNGFENFKNKIVFFSDNNDAKENLNSKVSKINIFSNISDTLSKSKTNEFYDERNENLYVNYYGNECYYERDENLHVGNYGNKFYNEREINLHDENDKNENYDEIENYLPHDVNDKNENNNEIENYLPHTENYEYEDCDERIQNLNDCINGSLNECGDVCENENNEVLESPTHIINSSCNIGLRDNLIDEVEIIKSMNKTQSTFLDEMQLVGRRIVDVKHLLVSFLNLLKNHSHFPCETSDIRGVQYANEGLGTHFQFICKTRGFEEWITSEKRKNRSMPINKLVALSSLAAGVGYEGSNQFLAGLNVPFMANKTYRSHRLQLLPVVEQASNDVMKAAAEEEKQIAIADGRVINEIPYIDVEGDGGYGKRSYRSGRFNSLDGVGVVIGRKSKKVLDVQVRQKYCTICLLAAKKNVSPKPHRCFKNWAYSQSSSSMETSCILKSFQNSVDDFGLIYKVFIADGDCTTFKALTDHDVYRNQGVKVTKLFCANHLFRNLCNKIDSASKLPLPRTKITGKILAFRKFIKKSALKLRRHIEFLIRKRREEDSAEKVKELRLDILNSTNHVFGYHKNCKSRGLICKKTKVNYIPTLRQCNILQPIQDAARKISFHANSLIAKVTTNASENFMSLMAKYTGGKRTFQGARDSYFQRCRIATIQCNTGAVLTTMSKYIGEDLSIAKKVEGAITKKRSWNNEKKKASTSKRRKVIFHDDDIHYGDNRQENDISPEEYRQLKKEHFKKLKDQQKKRDKIEADTIAQSDCDEWHEIRRFLLTASKFGQICKMQKTTKRANLVQNILYPVQLDLEQLHYGLEMEEKARVCLQKKMKLCVLCPRL
ncbi:hypothetical protein TKK_0002642 [Trichogramma kaykai]